MLELGREFNGNSKDHYNTETLKMASRPDFLAYTHAGLILRSEEQTASTNIAEATREPSYKNVKGLSLLYCGKLPNASL